MCPQINHVWSFCHIPSLWPPLQNCLMVLHLCERPQTTVFTALAIRRLLISLKVDIGKHDGNKMTKRKPGKQKLVLLALKVIVCPNISAWTLQPPCNHLSWGVTNHQKTTFRTRVTSLCTAVSTLITFLEYFSVILIKQWKINLMKRWLRPVLTERRR